MGSVSSSPQDVTKKPVVVVLGAGYAGVAAAKKLDASGDFNVVLVDRKTYFFHNVASLRAAVQPSWAKRTLIPYSNVLVNGTFLHAEVQEVKEKEVILKNHDKPLRFDHLVITLGSSYSFPGKSMLTDPTDVPSTFEDSAKDIAEAKDIVVIGAGPVGVELAGEIRHVHKDKNITVVQSPDEILQGPYPDAFREKVMKILKDANIKVLTGERVELGDDEKKDQAAGDTAYLKGHRTLTTRKGTELEADLVFFCIGNKTNSAALETSLADKLTDRKSLKTNDYLQVDGYDNIWACGDIANVEPNLAYVAGIQAEHLATNIQLANSKKPLKKYSPQSPAIMVPVGPDVGASALMGWTLGSWVTKTIKGKELFVGDYWKLNNAKETDNPDFSIAAPGAALEAAWGADEAKQQE